MSLFGWFRHRNDLPPPPAPPGEMRQVLTQEAARSQLEAIKQVEQATVLKRSIGAALDKLAEHTLEEVRRS